MSRLRAAADGATGLLIAGTLVLGGLWLRERARSAETPRWDERSFVALRPAGPAPAGPRAVSVMAVNPRCGRCVAGLWQLHRLRAGVRPRGSGTTVAALIVDTRSPPDAATLRALPPVSVWWDRDRVWRRRWGRRLYGEVYEFDAEGRHLRTSAPGEALRKARAAGGTRAPATGEKGGT